MKIQIRTNEQVHQGHKTQDQNSKSTVFLWMNNNWKMKSRTPYLSQYHQKKIFRNTIRVQALKIINTEGNYRLTKGEYSLFIEQKTQC